MKAILPPWIILDPLLEQWLREDIGRGDRTTQGIFCEDKRGKAQWIAKETGIIAGLPLAERIFRLLDSQSRFTPLVQEGGISQKGDKVAEINGNLASLLSGERTALNLAMRLSGIASLTRQYTRAIADLPTQLVDTRKTTPGLRILEKYASQVGGALNHRLGLDDAAMIKDNHIQAAGGIDRAITQLRLTIPYPLTIEVEAATLEDVQEALTYGADIIMLDNMGIEVMTKAVQIIRRQSKKVKIEASGNITLDNIRQVAQTGVDYISTSAPITRSPWLDLSMRIFTE